MEDKCEECPLRILFNEGCLLKTTHGSLLENHIEISKQMAKCILELAEKSEVSDGKTSSTVD